MRSDADEFPYRVVANRSVTPVIREVELAAAADPIEYLPGQYVLLCDADFQVPPRSYSVANAPRPDGSVTLLVTRVPGGPTSSWVHDRLRVGETVTLEGPYGSFVPDAGRDGPVLLLAAGSGLAPARALAQALLRRRPVTLFFSARTDADAIDVQEFHRLEARHVRFRFRYLLTLTREPEALRHDHIPELLPATVGPLGGWEVFVSGPPGFVTSGATVASDLGADAVHTEEFFTDPKPMGQVAAAGHG